MLICDCLLLISFYLLFVIYAVSVYFCHIYLSSCEKLWRFQGRMRLSLRLNHFCMLVALYLSTFINVCYCFIHIRVELLIV